MSTYRVGNHHGVTIVEQGGSRCLDEDHDCDRGHLAAVVVDGGRELAERICALLNAYMPSECTRVGEHNCDGEWRNHDRYEAPCGPLSATESASQPSVGGSGGTEPVETISGRFWGEHRAHPTCIDVTTFSQPPRSEWKCGPGCPREDA